MERIITQSWKIDKLRMIRYTGSKVSHKNQERHSINYV